MLLESPRYLTYVPTNFLTINVSYLRLKINFIVVEEDCSEPYFKI